MFTLVVKLALQIHDVYTVNIVDFWLIKTVKESYLLLTSTFVFTFEALLNRNMCFTFIGPLLGGLQWHS